MWKTLSPERRAATAALFIVAICAYGAAFAAGVAKVVEAGGGVKWKTQSSGWSNAKVGMDVAADTRFRVPRKSRVQVASGSDWSVTALADTEFQISGTVSGAINAQLESGDVVVKSKKPIRILAGALTIETEDAVFTVEARDAAVTAAVVSGKVCLAYKSETQCAARMEQVRFAREKFDAPAAPAADTLAMWVGEKIISPSSPDERPLLRVAKPQEGEKSVTPNIAVSGITSVGARILVNGREIKTKQNGEFSANVSLFEGENTISIIAISAAGAVNSVRRTVLNDTTPPLLTINQPVDNFDPAVGGACDNRRCNLLVFGLTEPGVNLRINNINVSRFIEGDGSFLIQDFPFGRTETTLTVIAEDANGRRATTVLHTLPQIDSDGDGRPDAQDACPLDPSC